MNLNEFFNDDGLLVFFSSNLFGNKNKELEDKFVFLNHDGSINHKINTDLYNGDKVYFNDKELDLHKLSNYFLDFKNKMHNLSNFPNIIISKKSFNSYMHFEESEHSQYNHIKINLDDFMNTKRMNFIIGHELGHAYFRENNLDEDLLQRYI